MSCLHHAPRRRGGQHLRWPPEKSHPGVHSLRGCRSPHSSLRCVLLQVLLGVGFWPPKEFGTPHTCSLPPRDPLSSTPATHPVAAT